MKLFHKKEVYEYVLNFLSPTKRSFAYQPYQVACQGLFMRSLVQHQSMATLGKRGPRGDMGFTGSSRAVSWEPRSTGPSGTGSSAGPAWVSPPPSWLQGRVTGTGNASPSTADVFSFPADSASSVLAGNSALQSQ